MYEKTINNTTYNLKETISLPEYKAIIDVVVQKCFDEDNNYEPSLKEYWLRYCVIKMYTDYFSKIGEKDKSLEDVFQMLYSEDCEKLYTGLFWHNSQVGDLSEAVNKKIDYKLNCIYKASSYSMTDTVLANLLDSLNELLTNGKLDKIISLFTNDNTLDKITVSTKDGE